MLISSFVHRDPDILGGVPVFIGTRVPVRTLFDYLSGGQSLNEFADDFPSVRLEQARGLLEALQQVLQDESYEAAA